MCRWFSRCGTAASFVGLLAVVGCDSDSFAPPATGGPRPAAISPGAMPAQARELALVLSDGPEEELDYIETTARVEVGKRRALFRASRPKSGGSATEGQAARIARAVAEGASALVVAPDESKETADALAAIDPKKVAVVLLGRAPAGGPGAATLVATTDYAASAKAIVGALVEDAKKAGFPPDAPVLLLKVEPRDLTSLARGAAIVEALKATKHPVAATVLVTSPVEEVGPVLDKSLKAHPNLGAAIADTDGGINLLIKARDALAMKGKFLVGGYANNPDLSSSVASGAVTAFAELNFAGLVRKAVQVALDRAEGKDVPPRVEFELPVRRATLAFVPSAVVSPVSSTPPRP